jgi:hypothetical protein
MHWHTHWSIDSILLWIQSSRSQSRRRVVFFDQIHQWRCPCAAACNGRLVGRGHHLRPVHGLQCIMGLYMMFLNDLLTAGLPSSTTKRDPLNFQMQIQRATVPWILSIFSRHIGIWGFRLSATVIWQDAMAIFCYSYFRVTNRHGNV